MVSPKRQPNASRAARGVAVLVLALGGWLGSATLCNAQVVIRVRPPNAQDAAEEDFSGVYLPTDRTLARAISRAEERIAAGEYHEALKFLDQILGREEDTFLGGATESKELSGLKSTARQLIAELPPAGRSAYELLYGATARRQLKEALADGDREGIARIVRQYFYTSAGLEAALVLAQMEFDSGHPLAAAHLYQELLESLEAVERFEPQLSILAALSWAAAGDSQQTEQLLISMSERFPGAAIEVAGRPAKLPLAGDDMVAWLTETVGRPQRTQLTDQDWTTPRGNPARNAEHDGGAPHLRARWEARVVNDPRVESLLASRSRQFAQRNVVAIPSARPIAVGDVVLMRTPANVVAVDWNTGKRIWETRVEIDDRQQQLEAELLGIEQEEEWSDANHPLEQRVWQDALAMSLGSDGERAYVLGGLSTTSADDPARWGLMPVFGGPDDLVESTNRLAAYELATEGKLVWELDGSNRGGDFSGVFFLGPPLAVDGSLFVIAEIRSALYLLALDPRTGNLQWRQQLANLEQGIALDPLRRLVGTSPSYSSGILVCPTTAGVIVAVDIIKRQFAWVYRYPYHQQSVAEMQNVWQQRMHQQRGEQNDRWLDGDVVLADGKVFVTPPESPELHCLDLRTGKLLWKHVREDSLYIGCANRAAVLLVGGQSLEVLRAEDGAPVANDARLDLPTGTMPAGHGYLSEGRYYLPLTSGQIVVVDLAEGRIVDTIAASAGPELGNLISHRGTVISQSALLLDKFEQIEALRERVTASLERNPDDAVALRELAELKRADGKMAEALELLKRAFRLSPDEPLTRDMLAETLLDVLATDYGSHQEDLPLLSQLVSGHQQQVNLLRIEAAGLQSLGKRNEAFDAYLRMADLAEPADVTIRIGAHHRVRTDRWIRAHLSALWLDSSSDEQVAMSTSLAQRRNSWGKKPTVAQLCHYLNHFDGLPGSDAARILLAQNLVGSRQAQEAEIELLLLEHSATEESQAAAAVLMTRLLTSTDRHDEARPFLADLSGKWKAVVALDGKTGQQWAALLASNMGTAAEVWPRGRVTSEVIPTSSPKGAAARRAQAERIAFLRHLRLEQVYPTQLAAPQWFLTNDCVRLVGRNAGGEDIFRTDFRRERQSRAMQLNNELAQAAQLGHLLFLSLGNEVVAIDSRPGSGNGVLWQVNPPRQGSNVGVRSKNRRSLTVYHPTSSRRRPVGPDGLPVGSLGPVSPRGVVYQDQDQLKCVDPVSGETLWSRGDVPPGCELFGDEQIVFAADTVRGTAQAFNAIDGTLLDERKLPEFPWLLTAGRNVVQLAVNYQQGPRTTLRVIDLWTGESLFETTYNSMLRMNVVEPNLLAIVIPGEETRFQCIDARTGEVLVDQPIERVEGNKAGKIEAFVSRDQLFLLVDHDTLQESRPIGPDYPVITGQVYAFDLQTGEAMWPGPARVRHRGIALAGPTGVPFLVFVDRQEKRDATTGTSSHLRLLCLDQKTGRSVFRDEELPDTAVGHFRVFADLREEPAVSIEMNLRTVRLMPSDDPQPPAPPANDDVEAARKSLGRGLWDVGRKMGDALQEALQNPGGAIWPVPEPNPHRIPQPENQNLFDND